jgi:methylated-DNA-[protein]-cysteine S-methyltransferase
MTRVCRNYIIEQYYCMQTSLQQKTYALLATVPAGRVTTYKALANALGTKAYRAVGQFMKHNPYSYQACPERSRRVPCHRVVASDGMVGGFNKGITKKIRMLRSEGIRISGNRIVGFPTVLFPFQVT